VHQLEINVLNKLVVECVVYPSVENLVEIFLVMLNIWWDTLVISAETEAALRVNAICMTIRSSVPVTTALEGI